MATPWTLVVAAPLARVAASVEPLAAKPALAALGADATVARFESAAASPGALSFELRGLLGAVVDEVGPEGLRAVDSLDGVDSLDAARKAPGAWVAPPPVASFADAASLFGGARRPGAAALHGADDLADRVHDALDARDDATARENKLRASRGPAEWGAVFGVKPAAGAPDPDDLGARAASGPDATKEHDAMRDALRADRPAAKPEAAPEKSDRRKALEDLVRGSADEAPAADSATPEGKVGES